MPRPTITGTVIRVIDMRHTGPGKNKDYRITITQEAAGMFRVYTEHGPAGRLNNGSERTIRGVSMSAATRMVDELCSQKRRQTDAIRSCRTGISMPPPRPLHGLPTLRRLRQRQLVRRPISTH